MSCTGNYHATLSLHCEPNMNEKLAKSLDAFSGHTRKAMKLLAKQYRVIAFESGETTHYQSPTGVRHAISRTKDLIRYCSKEKDREVFEWEISINDMRQ